MPQKVPHVLVDRNLVRVTVPVVCCRTISGLAIIVATKQQTAEARGIPFGEFAYVEELKGKSYWID
jgi:hypothetical protein